jgi:hypothetical protein
VDTGRWTIVSRALPAPRRSVRHMRARVNVRCVCGVEQTIFLEDLEMGSSRGCSSRACMARFAVSADVRATMQRWSRAEKQRLERAAQNEQDATRRAQLEQLARELYNDRFSSINRAIEKLLRHQEQPDNDGDAYELRHGA